MKTIKNMSLIIEAACEKFSVTQYQLEHFINELSKHNDFYWLNLAWRNPISVRTCRNLPLYHQLSQLIHLLKPNFPRGLQTWLALYFTVLFSDGFESGNFIAWSGIIGVPSVVENPVHHGTKAMRLIGTNGYCYKMGFNALIMHLRDYIYLTSTANQIGLLGIFGDWNELANFGCDGGKAFCRARTAGGLSDKFSATILPQNQWFCVEIECFINDGAGEAHFYLNNAELDDCAFTDLTNYDTGTCDTIYAGLMWSAATRTIYHDCVVAADAHIGPEATVTKKGTIAIHAKLAGII